MSIAWASAGDQHEVAPDSRLDAPGEGDAPREQRPDQDDGNPARRVQDQVGDDLGDREPAGDHEPARVDPRTVPPGEPTDRQA